MHDMGGAFCSGKYQQYTVLVRAKPRSGRCALGAQEGGNTAAPSTQDPTPTGPSHAKRIPEIALANYLTGFALGGGRWERERRPGRETAHIAISCHAHVVRQRQSSDEPGQILEVIIESGMACLSQQGARRERETARATEPFSSGREGNGLSGSSEGRLCGMDIRHMTRMCGCSLMVEYCVRQLVVTRSFSIIENYFQ